MKTKTSIAHLNGKEQHALRFIINRIRTQWYPLRVYNFSSTYTAVIERNCLAQQKNNATWKFDCGLLVLVEDHVVCNDGLEKERAASINPFGKLDLRIHTLSFFEEQLQEGTLFFAWVQRCGLLMYEKGK